LFILQKCRYLNPVLNLPEISDKDNSIDSLLEPSETKFDSQQVPAEIASSSNANKKDLGVPLLLL